MGLNCIAILLGAPLSAQNFERTGIPYLTGYAKIVVFDCIPWLERSQPDLHHESASWENTVKISTLEDFKQALIFHRPTYALDFIGINNITPKIQAALAESNTLFVVQKTGNLPLPSLWLRIVRKLKERLHLSSNLTEENAHRVHEAPSSLLKNSFRRIISTIKLRRALLDPDLALLAGDYALDHFTRRARNILWIRSQDFHIFQRLQLNLCKGKIKKQYAVFVDDNLPYASDWMVLGERAPVTPSSYYASMQHFFDELEKKWGIPIIIAAHPSSRYDKRVNEGFGNREIFHNRTAELVCEAQVVLQHVSTAVSFAVLAKKPIFFLTTNEMTGKYVELCIKQMALELGYAVHNIDLKLRIPHFTNLKVDEVIYENYKQHYLSSNDSTESLPWQEFIKIIKK